MDNFSWRLNQCMSKSGITQMELAQRTGMLPSQINHFCSGRREPSLRNLVRICESLPTADPVYLLGLGDHGRAANF